MASWVSRSVTATQINGGVDASAVPPARLRDGSRRVVGNTPIRLGQREPTGTEYAK